MPDQVKPVARPWQRFLRFSVRGLIVMVLVIGVWLGWLAHSARIRREAVAAILKAGGSVAYDWEYVDGNVTRGRKPWAPEWLVDLIGVDYFGHVTVALIGTRSTVTEAVMLEVGRMTQLQDLILSNTSVGDTGLVHLSRLRKLTSLHLSGTQITNAGLASISGLTSLSALGLSRTQVTDAGLEHLTELTKLEFTVSGSTAQGRSNDHCGPFVPIFGWSHFPGDPSNHVQAIPRFRFIYDIASHCKSNSNSTV